MAFPAITIEQRNEIERLILRKFWRPDKRSWEEWDPFDRRWYPTTPLRVMDMIRAQVDLVTKLEGRPEFHYKQMYANISAVAGGEARKRWLAHLEEDHNP